MKKLSGWSPPSYDSPESASPSCRMCSSMRLCGTNCIQIFLFPTLREECDIFSSINLRAILGSLVTISQTQQLLPGFEQPMATHSLDGLPDLHIPPGIF